MVWELVFVVQPIEPSIDLWPLMPLLAVIDPIIFVINFGLMQNYFELAFVGN